MVFVFVQMPSASTGVQPVVAVAKLSLHHCGNGDSEQAACQSIINNQICRKLINHCGNYCIGMNSIMAWWPEAFAASQLRLLQFG
jgi:hypothetical protein